MNSASSPSINHPLDSQLPSPSLIEMFAFADFEFVIIDNEHGVAGLESTENMLRAARASGIIPVVRCLEQDITRTLDMGASVIKVPMFNTAAQARRLVDQVRYPPMERRGCTFSASAAGCGVRRFE